MKRLIIIGAGGLGREVCGFAHCDPAFNRDWTIAGFLDDRVDIFKDRTMPAPLLGGPENYVPQKDDLFICGIMDPVQRERYVRNIRERGGIFTNVIHGTSTVSFGSSMGVGNVLGYQVAISCDVKIGDFVIFNSFASIGHDVVIEDFVSVHNRALISGNNKIGRGAEVGANCTILPKSKVEPRARVGAGSVLIGKAPSDVLMMGVPAKILDLPGTGPR